MRSRKLATFLAPVAAMLLLLALFAPALYGQRGRDRGGDRGRNNGEQRRGGEDRDRGRRDNAQGRQQRQAQQHQAQMQQRMQRQQHEGARRQQMHAQRQQHENARRQQMYAQRQQHENARRQQIYAQRQQHENARRQQMYAQRQQQENSRRQQVYAQRQQQQQVYRQQDSRRQQEYLQRQQREAYRRQQQGIRHQQRQYAQQRQYQNAYRQQLENARRQQEFAARQQRFVQRQHARSLRDSRHFYERQGRQRYQENTWPQVVRQQRWAASRLERQNRRIESHLRREHRSQQRLARSIWPRTYYRPQNAIVNATYPLVYQQIYADPNRGRWFNGYREYRRELRAMRRSERGMMRQQQRWAEYGYQPYVEYYPTTTYVYEDSYPTDDWGYFRDNFLRSVIRNAFSDEYYAPVQAAVYYPEPVYYESGYSSGYDHESYDPYYDAYDGYAGDYRAAPMYVGNGYIAQPTQVLEIVGAIAAPLLNDSGAGGVVSKIFSELLATGYDEGYVAGQYARENGFVDDGAFYDPYDPYVYQDVSLDDRSYNPYSCLGENRMYLSEGYELGYQDGVRDAQRQDGFDQGSAVDLVSVLLGNMI